MIDIHGEVRLPEKLTDVPASSSHMKATCTVPPYINLNADMRSNERANNEGSFAAALRKLAQQAPGFPSPGGPVMSGLPRGEQTRTTPADNFPPVGTTMMSQTYQGWNGGAGGGGRVPGSQEDRRTIPGRISGSVGAGTAPSIIPPVVVVPTRPAPVHDAEKQHEMIMKSAAAAGGFGPVHSHSHGEGHRSLAPHTLPSMYQYQREEHLPPPHRRAQEGEPPQPHSRHGDVFEHAPPAPSSHERLLLHERVSHPMTSSAPTALQLPTNLKERRPANIGVVHPQPACKMPDEEKPPMNSAHFPSPRTSDPSMIGRPPSPIEFSPRYGPAPPSSYGPQPTGLPMHAHVRPPQSGCPVHGHEKHRHDEHANRPPGMSFDKGPSLPPPHAQQQRDFPPGALVPSAAHAHAAAARRDAELPFMHPRHFDAHKEALNPHHSFHEDFRRRGVDYRWPGAPPHLLDEQYRRHIIGLNNHEPHGKEAAHGQMYMPHFYYNRGGGEYPPGVVAEHYLGGSTIPGAPLDNHRHLPPVPSQRLLDYYRCRGNGAIPPSSSVAEHSLHERARAAESADPFENLYGAEMDARRFEHEKNHERSLHRHAGSPAGMPNGNVDRASVERAKNSSSIDMRQTNSTTPRSPHNMPIFKGIDFNKRKLSPSKSAEPVTPSAVPTSLNASFLSEKLAAGESSSSEYAAASILANMQHFQQSPCSDQLEEISNLSPTADDKPLVTARSTPNTPNTEKKNEFMESLALIPHSKRRAIEEDYERKRWERKMRKFRGRPKKKHRGSEPPASHGGDTLASVNGGDLDKESDGGARAGSSERDFYCGPITRKKQQLLQEQETLLEQIQKTSNPENENLNDRVSEAAASAKDMPGHGNCDGAGDQANGQVSGEEMRHFLDNKRDCGVDGIDDENNNKNGDLADSSFFPIRIKQENDSNLNSPSGLSSHNTATQSLVPSQQTVRNSYLEQSRLISMLRDNSQRVSPNTDNSPPTDNPSTQRLQQNLIGPLVNSNSPQDSSRLPNSLSRDLNRVNQLICSDRDRLSPTDANLARFPKTVKEETTGWLGLDHVVHSFEAHRKDEERKCVSLKRTFDESQMENRKCEEQREQLERDMMVLNERRLSVTERRRQLRQSIERFHESMRSLAST